MKTETVQSLTQMNAILCCPKCTGKLDIGEDSILCADCHQRYDIADNIPLCFWPNEWASSKKDITDIVREFYEETPFPNYDDFDNAGSLMQKARQGIFARLLDDQIPFGARILECGCGTGQLSNFLSIANRTVVGTDICLNSLRLGQAFKEHNHLNRIHFFQMNLFRPIFKPETFDCVICNGVLHHTADPFLGYQSIARLVKPKGYILIGLYHSYGRISNDVRRLFFRLSGDRFQFLDPLLRKRNLEGAKRKAWFADQYKHPHESKHTIEEVIDWFEQTGFSFINSIPKTRLFASFFDENERIFRPARPGSRLERALSERLRVLVGSPEGGLFIAIGHKQA
jgi:SAM-dependent methyltransferase